MYVNLAHRIRLVSHNTRTIITFRWVNYRVYNQSNNLSVGVKTLHGQFVKTTIILKRKRMAQLVDGEPNLEDFLVKEPWRMRSRQAWRFDLCQFIFSIFLFLLKTSSSTIPRAVRKFSTWKGVEIIFIHSVGGSRRSELFPPKSVSPHPGEIRSKISDEYEGNRFPTDIVLPKRCQLLWLFWHPSNVYIFAKRLLEITIRLQRLLIRPAISRPKTPTKKKKDEGFPLFIYPLRRVTLIPTESD